MSNNIPENYRSSTELINMPWRITNELRRRFMWPIVRLHFALNQISWGTNWRIFGLPIIQKHRQSTITIGSNLELRSWYRSNPLVPNHPVSISTRTPNAIINIGDYCGFTGTVIVAAENITIGDHVIFGANTIITDTDFHPIDPERRLLAILDASHSPVIIEDNVFVGMNTIILKGVSIGEGSTIGAGSVVVNDIPSRSIAAGNPARVIREID